MSGERTEPRWVDRNVIGAVHADQIRQHGGSLGLRDEGLLDSALARSRNRWHYEPSAGLAELAAAYGYGIARNHPFIDGNKRVAFQAMYVFLGLNGYRIAAPEPEVVHLMIGVADGGTDEADLTEWLSAHMRER